MTSEKKETPFLEQLAKLGKAIGPFGIPFTLIFMGNVILLFVLLLGMNQNQYVWLVITIIAVVEIFLGFYLHKNKIEEPIKRVQETQPNKEVTSTE